MSAPFRLLRLGPISGRWQPRALGMSLLLVLAVLALAVIALGTGTLPLAPGQVLHALAGGDAGDRAARVVWGVRMPRVLTAALVGAALGMAGAVFQSISRNPLGSPDVIGFTTGAATGAIVQIVLFDAGALATAVAAMLSGLATALLVLALSWQSAARGASASGGGYRLVLVGVGLGAVLTGVNAVLLVMGGIDQAAAAQVWLAGSLNARSWAHVTPLAVGICLLGPVLVLQGRALTMIEMGEDAARPLGVAVGRVRLIAVLAAVALTALATAAAGPIAFIALAGPQLARRLTRSPAVPLASGAWMGAGLLLSADLVSQRFPLDLAMPVGLVTGFLGGLYLLWVLLRD